MQNSPTHLVPPLAERLMALNPGLIVRPNRNSRTLVSLRSAKNKRGFTLSIHQELLKDLSLEAEFTRFVAQSGHGKFPKLTKRMQEVFEQLQGIVASQPDANREAIIQRHPGHGGGIDLQQRLAIIQQNYWPTLSPVRIHWGRDPGAKPLRSIRFGCYRAQPKPQITIHPRLDLPWVPMLFVDHVIHHELCHHAQFCQPLKGRRREASHSPRFRQWEQEFSEYQAARAWEHAQILAILDPSSYQPSNPPASSASQQETEQQPMQAAPEPTISPSSAQAVQITLDFSVYHNQQSLNQPAIDP